MYKACGRPTGPAAKVLFRSVQQVYENSFGGTMFTALPSMSFRVVHLVYKALRYFRGCGEHLSGGSSTSPTGFVHTLESPVAPYTLRV